MTLDIDLDRFRPTIDGFAEQDAVTPPPARPVLFVGSSSIVLWDAVGAFPELPVVNRGFGGSTLAEVNRYLDGVVLRYSPSVIVLYCDNDLYLGSGPEEYVTRFVEFADRVERDLPGTRILVLSVKPTPLDDECGPEIGPNAISANRLIEGIVAARPSLRFVDVATGLLGDDGRPREDLFVEDRMHLNAEGYRIWNSVVAGPLAEEYAKALAQEPPVANSY